MEAKIKYQGKKPFINVDWLGKRYSFCKENNHTLIIPNSLFRFLMEAEPYNWARLAIEEELNFCEVCGKVFKSKAGLIGHKRFCFKVEKVRDESEWLGDIKGEINDDDSK